MRSDGEATRRRILDAAAHEFAQAGLAGARVDRIATEASASKERLYAYFGDKRALFLAVLTAHISEVIESNPMIAHDLTAFVGGVFDFVHEHPEHLRMIEWARLGGDLDLLPEVPSAIVERDSQVIRSAQESGLVDAAWQPADLFALLFSLATSWTSAAGMIRPSATAEEVARQRITALRAAAKIIAP